jgi:hypothetical protein
MTPEEAAAQLRKLTAQFSKRQMRSAIRQTLATEARKVRRVAVANLRKTDGQPLRVTRQLEKGIRAKVRKSLSGFVVAANARPGTSRGMYRNRFGKLKPVLYWFDQGTAPRYRKARRRVDRLLKRKGGYTGIIAAKGFIAQTERSEVPKVKARIEETYAQKVDKIARKYGYL